MTIVATFHEYFFKITDFSINSETKIVLRGENTEHLETLAAQAATQQLDCFVVHDAGLTQVTPGSATVLGIFGRVDSVDKVTGKLKLL